MNPTQCSRHHGYTLIEMLVVMLIMGMLLGLVSAVARPDQRTLLNIEADRLAQLLNLAATEARLTGKPIRWTADGLGYRFSRLHEGTGWSEVNGNSDLLRPRTMPDGISIADFRIEALQRQNAMRLDFMPHGLPLAYTIEMSVGSERIVVAALPFGDAQARTGSEDTHGNLAQP